MTAAGEGRSRQEKFYQIGLPFGIAALVVALPLVITFGAGAIVNSLYRAITWHRFLSGYALNFGWLHSWLLELWFPEKYGSLQNGEVNLIQTHNSLLILPEKILFYLSYAALVIVFARKKRTFRRLVLYSMLGYLSYFVFNTGVHENHLFPIACLAWILVFVDSSQLVRALNLTIAANANLFLFYGVSGQRIHKVIAGIDITLLFALANIALFVGMLLHTFRTDDLRLKFWTSYPRQV